MTKERGLFSASAIEQCLDFDGLPGHPRSSRGQAPGNDELDEWMNHAT